MPFGHVTDWHRYALPKPEILMTPLETNVIESGVLNAAGVVADASGPYKNRRYLLSGTILSKRVDNQYERYVDGVGQNIAGILFDTVEFADNTDVSDEPAAFLRRNVSFDSTKIVDYATYSADLATALPSCEFV